MNLRADLIQAAHELWFQANGRSNTRKGKEREIVENEQKLQAKSMETDFSDITKMFNEKGRGPHMLEMDFEPITKDAEEYVSDRTGKQTKCWRWRHKITRKEVSRYRTASGKSFDTGVLSIYLQRLKPRINKAAYERAVQILQLNSKKGRLTLTSPDGDDTFALPVDREYQLVQWVSDFIWKVAVDSNFVPAIMPFSLLHLLLSLAHNPGSCCDVLRGSKLCYCLSPRKGGNSILPVS